MKRKQILDIAVRVGAGMLKSGAEIYRVEHTIYLICRAYNMDKVDVYAIPSSIIATVECDGNYNTKTKQVSQREIDLDRLARLNQLSRYICQNTPDFIEVDGMIKELMAPASEKLLLNIFAFGIIGFCFTLFFGGNFIEAIVAIPIGMVMRVLIVILSIKGTNFIFLNIFGSFFAAAAVRLIAITSIISNVDLMTIGIIMALVPGMAVTNGMRDLIEGDFMAAMHRLIEALLVATGIALGTYLAISILS